MHCISWLRQLAILIIRVVGDGVPTRTPLAMSVVEDAEQVLTIPGEGRWHAMRVNIEKLGEEAWWTAVTALTDNSGYQSWLSELCLAHLVQHSGSSDYLVWGP